VLIGFMSSFSSNFNVFVASILLLSLTVARSLIADRMFDCWSLDHIISLILYERHGRTDLMTPIRRVLSCC
jgi:hypothetical protein